MNVARDLDLLGSSAPDFEDLNFGPYLNFFGPSLVGFPRPTMNNVTRTWWVQNTTFGGSSGVPVDLYQAQLSARRSAGGVSVAMGGITGGGRILLSA
jgi:hypothetical protein